MKKAVFLLIILTMSYLFQGCITQKYTERIIKKYSAGKEFLSSNEIDSNYTIGIERGVYFIKGIYIGKINIHNEEYYNFQFNGLLKGENRILDTYIPVIEKNFPLIKETDTLKNGTTAFLFKSDDVVLGLSGSLTESIFAKYSQKYENPNIFFDYINYDKSNLPDTIFFIGVRYLPVEGYSYPKSEVVLNIYNKSNNSFSVKRLYFRENEAYYNVQLKKKVRSRSKLMLNRLIYIPTIVADIITSPAQLFVTLMIRIRGVW